MNYLRTVNFSRSSSSNVPGKGAGGVGNTLKRLARTNPRPRRDNFGGVCIPTGAPSSRIYGDDVPRYYYRLSNCPVFNKEQVRILYCASFAPPGFRSLVSRK
ncbi:hypothetical protein GWI33_015367 [Rhynchophorus ferrugineus]|uniref:Uncharacterized protein n=1 Tax=Rhynchophorus ferrugineus TaxID=354439 RepID=A0A834MBH8_RHYFE|nr:hypothetical protein GWI33_015367 [Rhynchophorus ferrugineus]